MGALQVRQPGSISCQPTKYHAGITMPSAESQSQLIRDTYMRCGLDPVRDRPQYFEAHGTGTPAGDRK